MESTATVQEAKATTGRVNAPPKHTQQSPQNAHVLVVTQDDDDDEEEEEDNQSHSQYWSSDEEHVNVAFSDDDQEQQVLEATAAVAATAVVAADATYATLEMPLKPPAGSYDNNNSDDDDEENRQESKKPRLRRRRRRHGSKYSRIDAKPTPSIPLPTTVMSLEDIEICQRLDDEYERALEEREVGYTARFHSVRQSAWFSVVFMAVYLALGTLFFLKQADDWNVSEALLFSIYTITTVGYGHFEIPTSPGFQLYTIFYIFVGIATLTIMVAQVYQWLALEASRAQHSRDRSELERRGMTILLNTGPSDQQQQQAPDRTDEVILPLHHPHMYLVDRAIQWFERTKHFLRDHPVGRGLSVLLPFTGLILIGALVVGPLEGWTAVESLYFAVVSLTTVGFGDYYPTRTASIWFCILWLPFSVGFMSMFLGSVAHFYIRLSDTNIRRIERRMRRRIQRAKERAETQRAEVLKRAYRGQEAPNSPPALSPRAVARNQQQGFDVLPTKDHPEAASSEDSRTMSQQALFGTPEAMTAGGNERRERILLNSTTNKSVNGKRRQGQTMVTMKDVLRAVHSNVLAGDNVASNTGGKSPLFSIRSAASLSSSLQRGANLRRPSFALRVLVQERFAEIIAVDIAGYQSSIEIKENTLSVTIETLRLTADKWLVPRRARKAFRAVAFEALYFVGEHGLITRGADALYDLSPFEFHGLFSPLLAAMGDADTMQGWLAGTDVLADVDLKRDTAGRSNSLLSTESEQRKSDTTSEPRVVDDESQEPVANGAQASENALATTELT